MNYLIFFFLNAYGVISLYTYYLRRVHRENGMIIGSKNLSLKQILKAQNDDRNQSFKTHLIKLKKLKVLIIVLFWIFFY